MAPRPAGQRRCLPGTSAAGGRGPMHKRAAPGQLCPCFPCQPLQQALGLGNTALSREKEEQVQLSLASVLSGKEGEDGFRGSFDCV